MLFLTAFSQWALAFRFSCRIAPLRLRINRRVWLRGIPMLRLGIAFMLASMMNSGAEFLIRSYLNTRGSLETVGLFNAGITIVIIYAGMIFSVMESDYYPRLSAIRQKGEELNTCVNRQLEMNIMLIGPIIIAMIIGLPIIIPLLYNTQFLGMLGMTQIAALGMLFKAMYLPIEYLPLSRGESKVFLAQESFCVVLLIVCEIVGYKIGETTGIGCLTGLGGGIILGGHMFNGGMNHGVELGHAYLVDGGEPCTCGNLGCMEAYCAASALTRDGRRAMQAHPESMLAEQTGGDPGKITPKLVTDCAKAGDAAAKAVFDTYIEHLSSACASVYNILDPEVLAIGGGLSAAGPFLFDPLQEKVSKKCFYATRGKLLLQAENVMMGYIKADKPNVLQPADDWYDTGDIVNIDDDGFVSICGRVKRFAKVGGEMVSLTAIEQVIEKLYPNSILGVLSIANSACPYISPAEADF